MCEKCADVKVRQHIKSTSPKRDICIFEERLFL